MHSFQNLRKDLRSECQGKDCAADSGGRGITSADVVIHEEGCEISLILCKRRCLGRNRQHMLRRIQPLSGQRVLDEGLVCQRLKRRSGLGHHDKQRVCQIGCIQNSCRIVRIHIADEAGSHLQRLMSPCPVLQRDVKRSWSQIRSADSDLDNLCKLFALLIADLAGINLLCEGCNVILLLLVERTLVHAICNDIALQLSSGQLVKHMPLFSGIDDISVQKRFILVDKLLFLSQRCQLLQNVVIHILRRKVIVQPCRHRNVVFSHTLTAAFSDHGLCQIHFFCFFQLLKCPGGIQIVPVQHNLLLTRLTAGSLAGYPAASISVHAPRHLPVSISMAARKTRLLPACVRSFLPERCVPSIAQQQPSVGTTPRRL